MNESRRLPLHKALDLALDEECGLMIVALYELTADQLEALVEAAQLIDSEGCEILENAFCRAEREALGG